MTSLMRHLRQAGTVETVESRDSFNLPFQEFIDYFNFGGVGYSFGLNQTLTGDHEKPLPSDYSGLVQSTYRSNAIIFSLMNIRSLHFSEARFQFQQIRAGRPGQLFGTPELGILETPWTNCTTGDLLARMIQDVDLSGNSYTVRRGNYLARLRPDWVTILLGSRNRRDTWVPGDPDTDILAYIYKPGGPGGTEQEMLFLPSEIAHWAPNPDPFAYFRGVSWVTSILREAIADQSMVMHKQKFLDQGATVNLVVKIPTENLEIFDRWVDKLEAGHRGLANAYKTLYLQSGADATPVGSNFQEMTFREVQAAGETRMASVAGVPPILAGFTEGLSGASLNAGNYSSARRRFADGTIRPLWRQACGALSTLVNVPGGARLWYDDRDIAFLQDDAKDAAVIRQANATTAKSFIDGGWEADAIVDYLESGDISALTGRHTGMTSVQLQPPNEGTDAAGNETEPAAEAADEAKAPNNEPND